MSGSTERAPTDEGLRRDIGLLGASFLVLNGMIGAGIFALPAVLAADLGAFSPWVFLVFGLFMLCVVWAFGELASYFSTSGGPVRYVSEAFGVFAGFQTGWLYYISRLTALAANTNVLILYAASLWPALSDPAPRAAALISICAAFTIINVVGVKRAVRVLDGLTFLKVVPLLGLVLYGLYVAFDNLTIPTQLPHISAIEGTALLVIYAFLGFENSVVPAGETKNPRKTIPRSLLITVIGTAFLYFLVQLSYVAVVGDRGVEGGPLVEFGRVLAGPAGATVITLVAVFSVAGNVMGAMVGAPRTTFALAREGSLPAWFAHVSTRFGTPDASIVFLGVLGCILAVTGSFVWLAVISTLARLIVYGVSILALPGIRRRRGRRPSRGVTALFLDYAVPAIALATCGFAMAQSKAESWQMLFLFVVFGGILYLIARRVSGRVSFQDQ